MSGGGADAARRAAARILAEGRFHAGPIPRPLHGVLHAIGVALHPLFRAVDHAFDAIAGAVPGGDFVVWTILAGLVLLAGAALTLRLTRRVLRDPQRAIAPTGGPHVSAESIETAAVEAERAGRLHDAVRLRFQAGLMRLADRDLIDVATATPNAQLRRTLRSEGFDTLSRRFDEIVYGGDAAQPQDVEDARREWPRLVGSRR